MRLDGFIEAVAAAATTLQRADLHARLASRVPPEARGEAPAPAPAPAAQAQAQVPGSLGSCSFFFLVS